MKNELKHTAHSTYRCEYHIVFAPKYRRKEIYGAIKKDIGEILRKLRDFNWPLHINEGMFIENIVAQCLRANGHRIIFYVCYNEKNELALEIDFLIRLDRKVIPIEVKSSNEYTTKSLEKFKKSFPTK